jgi:hypothetical protein
MDRKNEIVNDLSLDVYDLYVQGEAEKQKEHDAAEVEKLGSYRVGSSGIVMDGGTPTGTCPRKAYLRNKGIEFDEKELSDFLMMEQGVWNEEIWNEVLSKTWPGKIRRESEVPVTFHLDDGTKITGRPDLVLCDADGTPTHGLELKNASSVWTGRDVLTERMPKVDHLIQAGLYMYGLQIPFTLCYVSRSKYAVPTKTWIERLFPKQGDPGSEWLEYNEKGGSKALKPFLSTFPLQITAAGMVQYHNDGKWHDTIVSIPKIFEWYEAVHSMHSHDVLPARPATVKVDGKKGFNPCDPAYCPLSDTCDRMEAQGKQAWEDAVRLYAASLSKK